MKIHLNKVTWYSKLLALSLFILLPILAFYFGIWYEKSSHFQIPQFHLTASPFPTPSPSPPKSTPPNSPPPTSPPITLPPSLNRNRSCNRPTIIIVRLDVSREEANQYFAKYGLTLEDSPLGKEHIGLLEVNVGVGNDTYWIDKIKQDGIGLAVYDTVGCDFRD